MTFSASVDDRRDDGLGDGAPALRRVDALRLHRLAVEAAGDVPMLAEGLEARADRAVDQRNDEVVVDAPLGEGQVVRAHLDLQAVGLLLVTGHQVQMGHARVPHQEVLHGGLVVGEVDLADPEVVLVDLRLGLDARAPQLDAVGRVVVRPAAARGRLADVQRPVGVEPAVQPELESLVAGLDLETRPVDGHLCRRLILGGRAPRREPRCEQPDRCGQPPARASRNRHGIHSPLPSTRSAGLPGGRIRWLEPGWRTGAAPATSAR